MTSARTARSQDEEFMYYLDFAKDYRERLASKNERGMCKTWIDKLRFDAASSEDRHIRNHWLCRLVICIQEGALNGVFLVAPQPGPLPEYPESVKRTVEVPAWLDAIVRDDKPPEMSRDGRTYLATKELDDGRGAFAYLAVTLNDGEPEWLPQAGREKLKRALSEGFEYELGDISQPDLATVLASRKTLEQRKAVFDYYNDILENIRGQLGGQVKEGSCDIVNDLVIRMVTGLRRANSYKKFLRYPRRERYFRLLERLARMIQHRIVRVERREILLDDVERRLLGESLFSATLPQEDPPWPGAEWRRYIPVEIPEAKMSKMKYLYPPELVETFRILLENEKGSVGERARRKHVDFVSELNEDLERERRAGEALCGGWRDAVAEAEAALAACGAEGEAARAPVAARLQKEIAETQKLLEELEEENVELLKRADELAMKAGVSAT